MPQCSQCGRTAFYNVNGHPLCIACNNQFEQAEYLEFSRNIALINACQDQFTAYAGIPTPRMQIRDITECCGFE